MSNPSKDQRPLKVRRDSEKESQQEIVLETQSRIGDCLLSEYSKRNDDDMSLRSEDDQLELLEEQVSKRMAAIKDMKTLHHVAHMTDEQMLTTELCKTCGLQATCKDCAGSQEPAAKPEIGGPLGNANILGEEEYDDDFECDIERYVPFNDKLALAEKLRVCH